MAIALLFPGQGSQSVGMGTELAANHPVARQTFEEADAANVEDDLRIPREQRIDILLQLQERMYPDAAEQRFTRVYRITQLERG